jgi:hypothetical protein
VSDEREHWAQSTAEPLAGAPKGVRPISMEGLGHLGVDGKGNLYWSDTKVLTAKKEFRLSLFQATIAVVTAFSAATAAAATVYTAYIAKVDFESQDRLVQIAVGECRPPAGAIVKTDSSSDKPASPQFTTENCITENSYRFAALNSSLEEVAGAVIGACRWEISAHARRNSGSEGDWRDRARFRVAEARSGNCRIDEEGSRS